MSRFGLLPWQLLLVAMLSGTALLPVAGADAPPPPPDGAATPPAGDETATEATLPTSNRPLSGSEQRRANDKGGVFRPSEDISEDLAVTFPVDI